MIRELFRQLGLVEEKKRKKSHPRFIKHPTSTYSREEWKQIKKMSQDYGRMSRDALKED